MELNRLFAELVGGESKPWPIKRLARYLEEQFDVAGVDDKIGRNIRVRVPSFKKDVKMPLG